MGLLETSKQKNNNISQIEAQLKSKTREIVRAYRHSWDIYSELLQNSVDAINRRYRILNDPDFYLYPEYRNKFPDLQSDSSYKGKIHLKIDVPKKEIQIYDNGVGIIKEKIEEFLLPDNGDKKVGREYGFKGYGLTYIAFISTSFQLQSRAFLPGNSETFEIQLDGLFNWLEADNGVPFPNGPTPDVQMSATNSLDTKWNTHIVVKLSSNYTDIFPAVSALDQSVNLINNKNQLEGFKFILRSRTAVGNTRVLFNQSPIVPIEVTMDIKFDDGSTEKGISVPYQYFHPKEHNEISPVSYEFSDYIDNLNRASFNRNFRGLFHTVQGQTVGSRHLLKCDFALSAISSTRLSNIEAQLGLDQFDSNDVGISYGVYLAINGMPTGLRIDDWDRKGGYLRRYFVLVDADIEISNQLDPGRKGISEYYAKKISDYAIQVMNESRINESDSFTKFAANYLDHGRGHEQGGLPPQDFQKKIEQTRSTGSNNTLPLLKTLQQLSSLTYFPSDEQEVIALFYQLLTKNVIKGYRTVYIAGSQAVYDAALEYEIECVKENLFDTDPLGIGQVLVQDLKSRGQNSYAHKNHYAGQTALPELCVDFKLNVGRLLQEVIKQSGTTNKDPKLIDLVVVWDTSVSPSIPTNSYTIDELEDNRRMFHGVTHRIGLVQEYNTEIQCIALKTVLERLSPIK